ncbi:unnamed protein product [Schistocephalus solidus]|uniref:Secreted protein n=1 Tax=Schistocephalus solidus TaxID=70667 RepID=A0A183SCG1_SCHSO|nr:unnamed protein product [Schistocephalus solidus]
MAVQVSFVFVATSSYEINLVVVAVVVDEDDDDDDDDDGGDDADEDPTILYPHVATLRSNEMILWRGGHILPLAIQSNPVQIPTLPDWRKIAKLASQSRLLNGLFATTLFSPRSERG